MQIHLLIDRNKLKINSQTLRIEFNNEDLKGYPQYERLLGNKLDFSCLSYNQESQIVEALKIEDLNLQEIKRNIENAYENYRKQ